jgi:hypothetical protein
MFGSNLPGWGLGTAIVLALLSIGIGLVQCFLGYRVFRLILGVYGFLLGLLLGSRLVEAVVPAPAPLLTLLSGLFCGLIGAALIMLFYIVGVFVVGAVAGTLLVNLLGASLGFATPLLVVLAGALLLGLMAVALQRPVIILITAGYGAWGVVGGLASLVGGDIAPLSRPFTRPFAWRLEEWPFLLALAGWLLLALAGALVQFRTTRD